MSGKYQGVEELIANLRNRENDWCLWHYLRVASYIDQQSIRACLKQMAVDASRDDHARTRVHGALARLGEKGSLEQLKISLMHKQPAVRLAAAESLWHVGNREGAKALMELLDLRPIESGGEGVETGGDFIVKVTAPVGTNLEYIRYACQILGDMQEPLAVEPLKRLLPLNLNGILAGRSNGYGGWGWCGRPDVVALAKLGDFSGMPILRASIGKGDPLGAVGDYVEIGLKRFIPDLFPLLEDRDENKRMQAAQAVLLLLENGR